MEAALITIITIVTTTTTTTTTTIVTTTTTITIITIITTIIIITRGCIAHLREPLGVLQGQLESAGHCHRGVGRV